MRGLVKDTKKISLANNNNNSTTTTTTTSNSSGSSKSMVKPNKNSSSNMSTNSKVSTKPAINKVQTSQNAIKTATKSSTAAGKNTIKQQQQQQQTTSNKVTTAKNHNNNSTTIAIPKASHANTNEEIAGGVQDTIYLCNFRVSVDGEWLCLKELQDLDVAQGSSTDGSSTGAKKQNQAAGNTNKRYSGGSGFSTVHGLEENGILAIEKLIGRRLYDSSDVSNSFQHLLTSSAPRNAQDYCATSNECSNFCRLLFYYDLLMSFRYLIHLKFDFILY